MIHSADKINFLGEKFKFSPNPLHKPSFYHYQPYQVTTHAIPTHKTEYPYVNMRFAHLRQFSIPHTSFKHPHLQGLEVEAPAVKHKPLREVEHLGLKSEMESSNKPNEIKLEMGLGNATVKDFAVSNLQEEVGTENALTRHRDESKFEDITTLPFEEQYKNFLEKKQDVREHNDNLNATIKDLHKTTIPESEKQEIEADLKKNKRTISHPRKKLVVQPVATTPPSTPAPYTPQKSSSNTTLSNKQKRKLKLAINPSYEPPSSSQALSNVTEKALNKPIPDDDITPAMSHKKKRSNKKRPMGDSVGKEVERIEDALDNSPDKYDIFMKSDLQNKIKELKGGAGIPSEVKKMLRAAGIDIPKGSKLGWLKSFLEHN